MATQATIFEGEVDKQGNAAFNLFHPRFLIVKEDGWLYSFKKRDDALHWKGAKQLLRLERKRGTVSNVPHSKKEFIVSRGGTSAHFRAHDATSAAVWIRTLRAIVDPEFFRIGFQKSQALAK